MEQEWHACACGAFSVQVAIPDQERPADPGSGCFKGVEQGGRVWLGVSSGVRADHTAEKALDLPLCKQHCGVLPPLVGAYRQSQAAILAVFKESPNTLIEHPSGAEDFETPSIAKVVM